MFHCNMIHVILIIIISIIIIILVLRWNHYFSRGSEIRPQAETVAAPAARRDLVVMVISSIVITM